MGAMDEETRERGIANIQAIRARMQRSVPDSQTEDPPPAVPSTPTDELDDPAAMAAAMAVGAERDRLERRVADLELEVRQLRAVLGRVLHEVAGAMNTPDRSEPGKAAETSSGAGS